MNYALIEKQKIYNFNIDNSDCTNKKNYMKENFSFIKFFISLFLNGNLRIIIMLLLLIWVRLALFSKS